MDRLFGTDGMRGKAGDFPLDPNSLHALGRALIGRLEREGLPLRVLIGRDTRESGPWIEQAIYQGLLESGGEPVTAGVIPTSAISLLSVQHGFSAGIVISASHNPFQDNGIKIFSSHGTKIPEDWELELELAVRGARDDIVVKEIPPTPDLSLSRDYMDFLTGLFRPGTFERPFKIVLDCSNGAASGVAEQVFTRLGAEVRTIHDSPDGKNINAGCGSLHPEILTKTVQEYGADLGVAYDGDADRCLWVDESGRLLNGDHTLYVLAGHMLEDNRLQSSTVVATAMSNMGLEIALSGRGLNLHRARVGDKFVLEDMLRLGSNLGGEQSGHTILLDDCPTGDGILTSIRMSEVMAETGASLSELVADYREFPQILLNVPVRRKEAFDRFPDIEETVSSVQEELGGEGRINLRYSGTEPLARVMIEGRDPGIIENGARRIAAAVTRHLGNE